MDAERWAISVVGQGVRGGVATGKMPSFERDQATCHVRITATARLSQRAAKDPERLHGNAAPMFYCGWSVMPLTVASECSQSQLVPREIGRKQGFLGCSFSLGEVPAAPASRILVESLWDSAEKVSFQTTDEPEGSRQIPPVSDWFGQILLLDLLPVFLPRGAGDGVGHVQER